MRLSTKRAREIRRGIVSGQILSRQIDKMAQEIPKDVFEYWVGLKLRSYVAEAESFAESDALHVTITPTLAKHLSQNEIKQVLWFSVYLNPLYIQPF